MQKVALVTGASSGIGKKIALSLLEDGYFVYGVARNYEKMQTIGKKGGRIIKMDITHSHDIEKVIEIIQIECDRVDVLINNAGLGVYGAIEDISISEAKYQMEVNLFGLAELTQKIIPIMRKQNNGKIINISSIAGKVYSPMGGWYQASKHALEGWSDTLRLELKPFNIDVVIVEPGIIGTSFGQVLYEPMMERAKGGHYESLTQTLGNAVKVSYINKNEHTSVDKVVQVLKRAINSKKPKTRYRVGKLSVILPFLRKWFGDKVFDRVILNKVQSLSNKNN